MSVTPRRIFLIRHGATEWSEVGRHTGRSDLPLTDEGRGQVERLRPRLAEERFDLVLVSPLTRALETARLTGFGDSEVDPDLMEWDYGDGHILRVITARWLEQPPVEGSRYHLDTGSLSLLGWERDTPVIERWNDSCHLGS